MASEVKLPRLGQGMESGTIVRWLKAEGDAVAKGEPLYELDTEKVTQEVEAEAAGVLLKIVVAEGEQAVGTTIAFIGEAGEAISADTEMASGGDASSAEKPAEAPKREPERERGREAAAATAEAQPAPSSGTTNGRVKASPLARRIARERGVELAAISGTGPEGRIVAEDVERAVAQGPSAPAPAAVPAGEVERLPLTNVRRTIARRLTEAFTIPVFQLTVSADMTRANGLVARHREANPDVRLTVTDVLTKVCARALLRHRAVNAQYSDEAILRLPTANIGIAAATPAGLYVPVIRSAERLTLDEIAAARADLVGRARDGKLKTHDLEEGTFTISNLGMPQYGIEQFVAVLNPPQAAILAVGATEDRVVAREGELEILPMVTLTGTFDHRAVDGADAAEFLATVEAYLEEPALAL
ncbi:MAG TPA: dihydrolipoamide acetyltransferase family protein [Gaiellaceae bacterium]|nr:dihydrolipoamide acetyltransferase family protein [Gaiellaceae bacterium]